jgi:hypothetical protein
MGRTEGEPDEKAKAGQLDEGRGEEDVLPAEEERDGPLFREEHIVKRGDQFVSLETPNRESAQQELTMRMVLHVSIVDLAVADSTLVMLKPKALNEEMESMLHISKDDTSVVSRMFEADA